MFKFAMLSSGSKGNSFVLVDQDTAIMIDCGTCMRYIKEGLSKINLCVDDLDAVLITHDHKDHISALKVVASRPIYAPVQLENFNHDFIFADDDFMINQLHITPIALSHDAKNTTGYVIDNGFEKLVYITDTGYVKEDYYDLLKGADYIILESNHDVEMLMNTSRPAFLKQRILGDVGHLNNEDCANILKKIVTKQTKTIILAHGSQEANTPQLALDTTMHMLNEFDGELHKDLYVAVAQDRTLIKGGEYAREEMDMDVDCCPYILEFVSHD